MSPAWKDYQVTAAQFFQRLGLLAKVEAELTGVRGVHKIDVLVKGSMHGIAFTWLVECKTWVTNVPKEKVMALAAIVQDVGADRGFLLSEKGFQSGAIRAARQTNITLASIDDLASEAQASLIEHDSMRLLHRRSMIQKRLWRLHKATGDYMSDFVRPMAAIQFVDLALDEANRGCFPVVYTVQGDERLSAASWDELVVRVTALLDTADAYAAAHEELGSD